MEGLISFWSYALAAAMFLALLIWRLGAGTRLDGHRLLLAAFALTACWAWLSAIDPNHVLVSFAETARNLVWVSLLYSLSATGDARQHGLRLVYGAVSAVFGLQLVADMLSQVVHSGPLLETETLLRITGAAGSLVLVHNLYGQAAPASRSTIRFAMLGLAMIWIYDLNLYTIIYLGAGTGSALVDWRGVAVALTAPLFALGAKQEDGWRIRLSRAATFQSLSLLAICGYFAVMTVLATALRGSGWDWSGSLLVGLLAFMTVASMVLLPSPSARSWAKVKLAKHLFEHRYDYRTEWLRFTETLGRAGTDAPPLGERVVKAFADIADAPGGLLLVTDATGALSTSAAWNWPGRNPPAGEHLRKRDRRRAGFGLLGEQAGEVGRQRAAVTVESGQEGRLRLPHDVAGDAHHHIVEGAVLEVVLETRAAGPRDGSVDHVQLAMVDPAQLALPPSALLTIGEEAAALERREVVHDDLRARRGEAGEHFTRRRVGPGAEPVDDHPHLDAFCQLALQQLGHLRPDGAFPPAEHEDVHGRARGLDVREDPREEVGAFDPGLDRRRRRPGEVESARRARLRRLLRAGRRHRVARRRPARPLRNREHPPVELD